MDRAKLMISLMKLANLSKYYAIDLTPDIFVRTSNYSILVVGQVEDDASLIYGQSKIKLNTDLVIQARKEHPTADIYFKPHPDYISNNRRSISEINKIKDICAILDHNISLETIFRNIDHVYTMTSLVGLEALINGLKVTTFGVPFYSNWGLTDDRVKIQRRSKKLSIEELVAGSYFLYPKYLHLESDEFITFEEASSYFIFETLKETNIFELYKSNKLYRSSLPLFSQLSIPLQVLEYLNKTETYCEAIAIDFFKIINKDFKLSDYSQVSYALIETSNYTILAEYSNICIEYLKENLEKVTSNTTLFQTFLYALSLSLKYSAGRVTRELPDLTNYIFDISSMDDNIENIYLNYIVCCSSNLQYELINKFINRLEKYEYSLLPLKQYRDLNSLIDRNRRHKGSAKIYKKITLVLSGKPSRSERNSEKRHRLRELSATFYLKELHQKYNHSNDISINEILYNILLENNNKVEIKLKSLLNRDNTETLMNILTPRINDFLYISLELIKNRRFNLAKELLDTLARIEKTDWHHYIVLYLFSQQNKINDYYMYLNTLSIETKKTEKIRLLIAQVLRREGSFDIAKIEYIKLRTDSKTQARKMLLSTEISKIDFLQETSRILNAVPQPKLPKGIAFLSSQTCFDSLALITPALVELKRKGYAIINLNGGMTKDAATGFDFIDKFSGIIPLDVMLLNEENTYFNAWNIDWENRRVVAEGINFYQGFYERISTFIRRFHVDINMPLANKTFQYNLLRADMALHVCKKIYSEIVLERNIPVTFISGNTHIPPYSIFRDFAMHKNHEKLGFINFNVAYESYFSNVGSKFANTMAVTDMTLYPTLRAPFLARRDQFEKWYSEEKDNKEYLEKAQKQLNVNRVGNSSIKEELSIITLLKEEKMKGKKIICAFGKVPVDLNVPIDGGNAHTDMSDWISHTVEVCNDREDIILLVKPHPHELKPEIALDLVESFFDLIKVKTGKNIILLDHKEINNFELAPYLDLGILYNGSTSLELVAQGIPVILASYYGKHDYPIDLIYPTSREDYKEFIQNTKYPIPNEELQKKAAFLISYLGTDEISIINRFSLRRLTNDGIGIPSWRNDLIDVLLDIGDEKMKLVANKMVEKFEK